MANPIWNLNPFWLRRARGQTGYPVIDKMFTPDPNTGRKQTVFTSTHPLGRPPSNRQGPSILYPSIRWRSPGLERLTEKQALEEAFRKKDYLIYKTLWDATRASRNLSKGIKR
jgi:hypothetical protein